MKRVKMMQDWADWIDKISADNPGIHEEEA